MNYGIQYLAHLVQIKNDLNRKRRRFYAMMRGNNKYYTLCETDRTYQKKREELLARKPNAQEWEVRALRHIKVEVPNLVYTKTEAKAGYELAKQEMKAMTAEMRRARKEINASFQWSDHGAISYVILNDQRYTMREIARFAELYKADAILLGD